MLGTLRATREFQSTCPARGTTKKAGGRVDQSRISIHVPREGHDDHRLRPHRQGAISIHVPREGHDAASPRSKRRRSPYFNPRAPRGARPSNANDQRAVTIISIHVPREGHDDFHESQIFVIEISIHVPREGHDRRTFLNLDEFGEFQSTCPARGTTIFACC